MPTRPENALEALSRASDSLARETDVKGLISTLVDQAIDITRSDVAAFYTYGDAGHGCADLAKSHQRGRYAAPNSIPATSETVEFIEESGESVVLLDRKPSPFENVFLNPNMRSGIALGVPYGAGRFGAGRFGVLILNSTEPLFYGRRRLHFLDAFSGLATRLLGNVERMDTAIKEPTHFGPADHVQQATVLFADVSGYPIEVLKEHFEKIAGTITKYRGRLDPFIGESIQATFGTNSHSEENDAHRAVRCALELKQLTSAIERALLHQDVRGVKIGIGIHSGPVFTRATMSGGETDHLILGDTIRVAERLRGIVGAGEILITQNTMDLLETWIQEGKLSAAVERTADSSRVYRIFEPTD
jgi:class 3 adenylate cyclase